MLLSYERPLGALWGYGGDSVVGIERAADTSTECLSLVKQALRSTLSAYQSVCCRCQKVPYS